MNKLILAICLSVLFGCSTKELTAKQADALSDKTSQRFIERAKQLHDKCTNEGIKELDENIEANAKSGLYFAEIEYIYKDYCWFSDGDRIAEHFKKLGYKVQVTEDNHVQVEWYLEKK